MDSSVNTGPELDTDIVGRVLRASTRGFSCGTHSARIDNRHDFGAFVKVPIANDDGIWVIGLIYAVEIKDDLMVSELVMADAVNPNVLRDQRENRMVPVEISVLNIGYWYGPQYMNGSTPRHARYTHSLPPRPPMSLTPVTLCDAGEVTAFTSRKDYFRLVLSASEVPSDDLMASSLRYASYAWPEEMRRDFMIESGRQLARLLSGDLKKLAHILALIRM
jgi:hypothetical protein